MNIKLNKIINFFYRLFINLLYIFFSIFIKKNKVLFVYAKTSKSYANIPILQKYIKKHYPIKTIKYDYGLLKRIFRFSSAKIIILDQTNKDISYLHLAPNVKVIQLWHGSGEYKSVGFDALRFNFDKKQEMKRVSRLHSKYDYVICSDKKLVNRYASFFHINKKYVLPIGSPRMDAFFKLDIELLRKQFCLANKISCETKIIMYCPTFRKNYEYDNVILKQTDIKHIENKFKNCKIFTRLHPTEQKIQIADAPKGSYLMQLAACDLLISDYSSIIFDYAFFHKPIILYIPDLTKYIQKERKLYVNPEDLVGNEMTAYNINDLIACINSPKVSDIWHKYMSGNTGESCKKLDELISKLIKS